MAEYGKKYINRESSPSWEFFTDDVRKLKAEILPPTRIRELIAQYRDPSTPDTQKDQTYQAIFNSNIRLLHRLIFNFSPLSTDPADSVSEVFGVFDVCLNSRYGLDFMVDGVKKIVPFTSYLSQTVRKTLISPRAQLNSYPVRLPPHVQQFANALARFEQEFAHQQQRLPTENEVIDHLSASGADRQQVTSFYLSTKNATRPVVSIERTSGPVHKEEQTDFEWQADLVAHNIPDLNSQSPEQIAIERENRDEILQQLDTLPIRQRFILLRRMGYLKDRSFTLDEIGSELGISRERVRQIEAKALKSLKHNSVLAEIAKTKELVKQK